MCRQYFKIPNDFIILTYSTNKMENVVKYKDTLPYSLYANVVYKFKCGSCNATYVGQIGRHLRTVYMSILVYH